MTDGTTCNARVIPTGDSQALLVFATKTGQLSSWTMTAMDSPTPPIPPTPPLPPTPTPASAAAIVTVTATAAADLPAETAAYAAANGIAYHAYTVAQVAEKDTPPAALTWIGAAAGKPLPYSFIAAADGSTLWQGSTPADAAAWSAVLSRPNPSPTCPGGSCPCR